MSNKELPLPVQHLPDFNSDEMSQIAFVELCIKENEIIFKNSSDQLCSPEDSKIWNLLTNDLDTASSMCSLQIDDQATKKYLTAIQLLVQQIHLALRICGQFITKKDFLEFNQHFLERKRDREMITDIGKDIHELFSKMADIKSYVNHAMETQTSSKIVSNQGKPSPTSFASTKTQNRWMEFTSFPPVYLEQQTNGDLCEAYNKIITTIRNVIMEFSIVIQDLSVPTIPEVQKFISDGDSDKFWNSITSDCERIFSYLKFSCSEYLDRKDERSGVKDQLYTLSCQFKKIQVKIEEISFEIENIKNGNLIEGQVDVDCQTDLLNAEEERYLERVREEEKYLQELKSKDVRLKLELCQAHLEFQDHGVNNCIWRSIKDLTANKTFDMLLMKKVWKSKMEADRALLSHSSEKLAALKSQLSTAERQISTLNAENESKDNAIVQKDIELSNLHDEITKYTFLVDDMQSYPDLLGTVPLAEEQNSIDLTMTHQVEINMARIKALLEINERYKSLLENLPNETIEPIDEVINI